MSKQHHSRQDRNYLGNNVLGHWIDIIHSLYTGFLELIMLKFGKRQRIFQRRQFLG